MPRFEFGRICFTTSTILVQALLLTGFTPNAHARDPMRTAELGFDAPVHALTVYDGTLVAGGDFAHAGGISARYLAAWDGQIWQPFEPSLDGPVWALLVFNGDLIVGGDFTHAGTVELDHIARLTTNGWASLDVGTDGPVRALIARGNYILYAAGSFTQAGGIPALSIARWAGNTWSAIGTGLEGETRALAFYGSNLIAGGGFRIPGYTIWQRFVGRFNGFNTWLPIVNGITGDVSALALYRGSLVMGGAFTQADFVTPAYCVARLDGETWAALNVGFWIGDQQDVADVKVLHAWGDSLYAGGTFTHADGQLVNHVAVWDGYNWAGLSAGMNGTVTAFTNFQGALIAGGDFTEADGKPVNYGAQFWQGAWYPLVDVVAVEVEDLEAASAGGRVRLVWKLAEPAQRALQGVNVERATDAAGPYARRTSAPLAPERDMSFEDVDVQPGTRYWYRLQLVARDGAPSTAGPVAIQVGSSSPSRTGLRTPFESVPGAAVVIGFSVGSAGGRVPVRLEIYDARGRVVRGLDAGARAPGDYERIWDRRDDTGARVARGLYFVHLRAGGVAATRKLMLLHG
jgi:hypothetical protein